ncbi:two-component system, OmpR family, sensor histidine kinase MprB [Microlunatus sagamiharensis]|uniref:histidine kinase n=1 Tax=Microlunatus sagamiharensis TaxID=546874 RepID=A0A1H2LH69_9ACTN|nr:HAMP domain-containing sensor histidine kinase [Microlunatus sagamiharensis]SDU80370.1 two-component system, OmpR family, sensor histidine kinase MprB [Microlunatus sagamiharensis]
MTRPATPDAGPTKSGLSLERRVGRFTLLIVALAVLVTGLSAYAATRATTVRAIDDVLDAAAAQALRGLGPDPSPAAVRRYLSRSAGLGVVVTTVVSADGTTVAGPGAGVVPVDAQGFQVARTGSGLHRTTVRTTAGTFRVLVLPMGDRPGQALLVARSLSTIQQILQALAASLLVFGLLSVLAAGGVGRRVARAGVAPVRSLTREVEQRAVKDELSPVRVERDDELGRLATAFNHLLETIAVSRVRQARFVADAGHELRTPLTSMRTNVELLVADSQRAMLPPDDRLTIMRDVQAQLVEFSTLVSDLVGLTREDRTAAELGDVDLTAVLEEAVDRTSMRATGLRWQVDLDPVHVNGDADLLVRALGNVLDNAVKFSPVGGTITVSLHGGEIRVADEGRGVEPAERPFVFDRFYRAEASRATPGTGLGLAITESVVHQHGGTVLVTDAPGGGALFVVTLPTTKPRTALDDAMGAV